MKVRDDALVQTAQYDAQANAYQAQEQALQQQQAADASKALVESVTTYSDRADKLGITTQELQQAGNVVAQHGIGNDIAQYILADEQGPNITMYLAQNPLEMEAVRQMSPMQAAVYIDTQVKAKAVSARPTPNPISEPTEVLRGAGQPEGDRGPKGAIYE
jgi:preprotein translocase subunit SecD